MKKIVIAGGSGCLGRILSEHFINKSYQIVVLSRNPAQTNGNIRTVDWDGKTLGAWVEELNGADVLINLTGKNVNCRYNQKNRNEILSSRIDSVNILDRALHEVKNPPSVWIQAASATIYRHAEDRPMDERSGEAGEGFSVDVCQQWENTFWKAHGNGVRKILLRIGIVLDTRGGALPALLRLAQTGLGGKQGSGNQYISWIHATDVAHIFEHIIEKKSFTGTFNCTSPFPVKNHAFMSSLRDIMKARIGFPTPTWLLQFGAWLIQTETELILKSRWVVPGRLQQEGYVFHFPRLREALSDLLLKK